MLGSTGENVFFADLHHPGGEEEEINRLLEEIPPSTKRVFFLGDCFHYWINDPRFIQETYSPFLKRLRELSHNGVHLFFLEGNRDFLASHYLDAQPWIDVLINPSVIELGGRAVYLGHGDELCWNDWAYQTYKTFIRSSAIRYLADRLPGPLRRKAAAKMSTASKSFVAAKPQISLKVPSEAYEQVIDAGVDVIIHGHVHDTYQRAIQTGERAGVVYCFGWSEGKRNFIHFEG